MDFLTKGDNAVERKMRIMDYLCRNIMRFTDAMQKLKPDEKSEDQKKKKNLNVVFLDILRSNIYVFMHFYCNKVHTY